jgi:hypothetical protein
VITLTPGIQIEVEIGGGWTPLQLSNLVAYYNAGLGVTQSSGNVSQWNDQSGNGYNLTIQSGETNQTSPSYSATGFNASYSGITCSPGGDTGLGTSQTAVTFNQTVLSIFLLLNTQLSGNTRRNFSLNTTASSDFNAGACGLMTNGALTNTVCYQANDSTGLGSANTNEMIGFTFDGTNNRQYLNGSLVNTFSYSAGFGGSGGAGINLGSSAWFSAGFASEGFTIAYAILTAAAMSATDISNLKTWTNANWGTSF